MQIKKRSNQDAKRWRFVMKCKENEDGPEMEAIKAACDASEESGEEDSVETFEKVVDSAMESLVCQPS